MLNINVSYVRGLKHIPPSHLLGQFDFLMADFYLFLKHFVNHCFIRHPSDSVDAGMEPRTVATVALAVATLTLAAATFALTAATLALAVDFGTDRRLWHRKNDFGIGRRLWHWQVTLAKAGGFDIDSMIITSRTNKAAFCKDS